MSSGAFYLHYWVISWLDRFSLHLMSIRFSEVSSETFHPNSWVMFRLDRFSSHLVNIGYSEMSSGTFHSHPWVMSWLDRFSTHLALLIVISQSKEGFTLVGLCASRVVLQTTLNDILESPDYTAVRDISLRDSNQQALRVQGQTPNSHGDVAGIPRWYRSGVVLLVVVPGLLPDGDDLWIIITYQFVIHMNSKELFDGLFKRSTREKPAVNINMQQTSSFSMLPPADYSMSCIVLVAQGDLFSGLTREKPPVDINRQQTSSSGDLSSGLTREKPAVDINNQQTSSSVFCLQQTIPCLGDLSSGLTREKPAVDINNQQTSSSVFCLQQTIPCLGDLSSGLTREKPAVDINNQQTSSSGDLFSGLNDGLLTRAEALAAVDIGKHQASSPPVLPQHEA
uniref:Uncharacterized protein n=1 Tax=Timema cristinae TaxID=61476 RepID=A0A7R9CCB0_TIMCR|nr:unnamed protein product [Timema cristinae]